MQIKNRIAQRDGWDCHYCTKSLCYETATIDHFTPKSLGGNNKLENLRLACKQCNQEKSSFIWQKHHKLKYHLAKNGF